MGILLSHGGGGRKTRELIKNVFLREFSNEKLAELGDSAVFDINGEYYAFTTDSYVVNPIFFPGGDIGKLAVSGTINDLAAVGAEPLYISCAFIIEEGFPEEDLQRIVKSISRTASECGVQIVTGDTKVVEKGKADGLYINTSGFGKIVKLPPPSIDRVEPGDKIIINGTIGDHGIAVMAAREKLVENPERIRSDCAPLWSLVREVLENVDVKFMRDPTRGGLAAVLNEIVEDRKFGIVIHEDKIPVRDNVAGVAELLGIDPIFAANEGKMVFVVKKDEEEKTLEILRSHELGREASAIGEISGEIQRKVVLMTKYGTRRIVEMPYGEQLPRIC